LTVEVCPDPSTICTFTPDSVIVGFPSTPEELKLMCGSTAINVC
jgi:hypothetical protein